MNNSIPTLHCIRTVLQVQGAPSEERHGECSAGATGLDGTPGL